MMDAARLVSTATLREGPRSAVARLQAEIRRVEEELATGRVSDIGLRLGVGSGTFVSVQEEQARLSGIRDANGLVSTRLDASQAALKAMLQDAQGMLGDVIAAQNSAVDADIVAGGAQTKLGSLIELLGTTIDNTFVFSGTKIDVMPMADYFGTPAPSSRAAVDAAFLAEFGVTQSNPAVQSISASQVQTFLQGQFAALFDDARWAASWSAASDQTTMSRISNFEFIEASVSANATPFRQLAQAYVMIADLGAGALNDGARGEIYARAAELLGESAKGLGDVQGSIGIAQERVARANERLDAEGSILRAHVGEMESVDPAELATRLSTLTSQIEMAYALTARIHRLSLLEFI